MTQTPLLPAIGKLRHRVTLETPARTSDGAGGSTETWTPVAELFAFMRAIRGDERTAFDRITGHVSHEFYLRAHPGLAPKMRFRLGIRRFHIHAVLIADEHGRRMRCLCEERDL